MNRPTSAKIALVQMQCAPDPQTNRDRAAGQIEEAAANGAQIVCLPELFCGHYFCQTEDHRHFALAEPIPGPTTEQFSPLAARLGVVIVASLFEKRAEGLYHNTCAVIDADGSYLGKYRKMHIPDDPQFYEKFYFTPGDLGFRVFQTKYANIGVLICWDQWFPEAARLTAMQGADLLVYPTAIGWIPEEKREFGADQMESWKVIQRSHAVANGCFVASVNRIGTEGTPPNSLQFWGNSFVCDTNGKVLSQAGDREEEIVFADLNFSKIDLVRTHWPFLRDRRIDAYQGITSRFLDSPDKT